MAVVCSSSVVVPDSVLVFSVNTVAVFLGVVLLYSSVVAPGEMVVVTGHSSGHIPEA